MDFPTLYKLSSTGKLLFWFIEVRINKDCTSHWDILTTHGQDGGKLQTASDTIREGKNLGKANETSSRDQAFSEAGSKWKKQFDKGYVEDPERAKRGETDVPGYPHRKGGEGL